MISFAPKSARMAHLKKADYDWGIWVHELPKPTVAATITPENKENPEKNFHYMYVCIKGKKNEEDTIAVEGATQAQWFDKHF